MPQQQVTPPIRVPLVAGIERRSTSEDKDELAVNLFYDTNKNVDKTMYGLHDVLNSYYATKRPGIASYISASGQAQGTYTFDTNNYAFTGYDYYWEYPIYDSVSGKYIVMGANFNLGGTFLYAQTSPDGINWTTSTVVTSYTSFPQLKSSSTLNGITVFTAHPQSVVAVPSAYTTSNGGTTFSENPLGITANTTYRVTNNGSFFLAWSGGSRYVTSTDGLTWTPQTVASPIIGTVIAANPSIWVMLPNSGTSFRTSTDGTTWTSRTLPVAANWLGCAWSETLNLFVAVSSTGVIIKSSDGITWTNYTPAHAPTVGWVNVQWTGTYFVAAVNAGFGNSKTFWYSSDGTNWSYEQVSLANGSGWPEAFGYNSGVIIGMNLDGPTHSNFYFTSITDFKILPLPVFSGYGTPIVTGI